MAQREHQDIVYVRKSGFADAVDIWILRYEGGERYCAADVGAEGGLVFSGARTIEPMGTLPAPTLSVPARFSRLLLEGLAQEGVKMPDQTLAEGKLAAQTEHLGDLRKLLGLAPGCAANVMYELPGGR